MHCNWLHETQCSKKMYVCMHAFLNIWQCYLVSALPQNNRLILREGGRVWNASGFHHDNFTWVSISQIFWRFLRALSKILESTNSHPFAGKKGWTKETPRPYNPQSDSRTTTRYALRCATWVCFLVDTCNICVHHPSLANRPIVTNTSAYNLGQAARRPLEPLCGPIMVRDSRKSVAAPIKTEGNWETGRWRMRAP